MPYRVLQTLPDLQVGGGQVMALNAIRQVDPAMFRFDVLALHPDTATMTAEFRRHGVEPYLLEHRSGRFVAEVASVARVLRRRRIDLVHVHGHDERQIVLPAALALGVPAICQLNSEWVHLGRTRAPDGAGLATRLRRAAGGHTRDTIEHRAARLYLASSEATEARFRPWVRAPLRTLAQSVPAEVVAAAAARPDPAAYRAELGLGPGPVAINVARAVPGKGHERLLRNFRAVLDRRPEAQLVLVGEGELHEAHRRLADELGLGPAVRFLGARRDVPRLLAGADLFVFTSVTESFGLVVAEAMAAGLAVVASRLPSLDGFCRPGVTGEFPEQDDAPAFVAAVVDLLGDADQRRRMGAAGAEAVLRRYPVDATARDYEAAYREVLAGEAVAGRGRLRRRHRRPAGPPAPRGWSEPAGPPAPRGWSEPAGPPAPRGSSEPSEPSELSERSGSPGTPVPADPDGRGPGSGGRPPAPVGVSARW